MNNISNSRLIYGCMGLGGDAGKNTITKDEEKQAEDAVFAALEAGIDFFDHADIYAAGKAERAFGLVLKNNPGLRKKILIQSKAGIQLGKGPLGSAHYNLSKEHIVKQVELILERLQTDYLDSFLLHRPDPLLDVDVIAETFQLLKERGFVRNFGVSNMSVSQMKHIQNACKQNLIANQIQLSLGHSLLIDVGANVNTCNLSVNSGMDGLLEYCQANKVAIQTWGTLDQGLYTGKPCEELNEIQKNTTDLVSQLAEKYETTKPAILLAWLFKIPGIIQPIVGTTKPQRILACKDAMKVDLSREDWYGLWITAKGCGLP